MKEFENQTRDFLYTAHVYNIHKYKKKYKAHIVAQDLAFVWQIKLFNCTDIMLKITQMGATILMLCMKYFRM